eukprot:gnl/MRDRNA2_/MRDRNA2_63215_c0_seq1.p1 gnl/MRDRNA2_/MRDRNA2_63215_c0~~gnl/MRDRNA2_/MRDRNA2_63215_c0_seq1.p1  ORF type:complete len:869 (+),score=114.03 gnl/MRDRNA2_/MRDRNA2_63215_c0_seq1:156-2609(+)
MEPAYLPTHFSYDREPVELATGLPLWANRDPSNFNTHLKNHGFPGPHLTEPLSGCRTNDHFENWRNPEDPLFQVFGAPGTSGSGIPKEFISKEMMDQVIQRLLVKMMMSQQHQDQPQNLHQWVQQPQQQPQQPQQPQQSESDVAKLQSPAANDEADAAQFESDAALPSNYTATSFNEARTSFQQALKAVDGPYPWNENQDNNTVEEWYGLVWDLAQWTKRMRQQRAVPAAFAESAEGVQNKEDLADQRKLIVKRIVKMTYGTQGQLCTDQTGEKQSKDVAQLKQVEEAISKLGNEIKTLLKGPKAKEQKGQTEYTKKGTALSKELEKIEYCITAFETRCYHMGKKCPENVKGILKKYLQVPKDCKVNRAFPTREAAEAINEPGSQSIGEKYYITDALWAELGKEKLQPLVEEHEGNVLQIMQHTEEFDNYKERTKCQHDPEGAKIFKEFLRRTRCGWKRYESGQCFATVLMFDNLEQPPPEVTEKCEHLLVPQSGSDSKCGRNQVKCVDQKNSKDPAGTRDWWMKKVQRHNNDHTCCCKSGWMWNHEESACNIECGKIPPKTVGTLSNWHLGRYTIPLNEYHWFAQQQVGIAISDVLNIQGVALGKCDGDYSKENCIFDTTATEEHCNHKPPKDHGWLVTKAAGVKNIRLNYAQDLRTTYEETLFNTIYDFTTVDSAGEIPDTVSAIAGHLKQNASNSQASLISTGAGQTQFHQFRVSPQRMVRLREQAVESLIEEHLVKAEEFVTNSALFPILLAFLILVIVMTIVMIIHANWVPKRTRRQYAWTSKTGCKFEYAPEEYLSGQTKEAVRSGVQSGQ